MRLTRSVVLRWWIPGNPTRSWSRTFPADRSGLHRARQLAKEAVKRGRAFTAWYITETIP